MHRLDFERSDLEPVARLERLHVELRTAVEAVALGVDHAGGERRRVDLHAQLVPQREKGAVMVLVRVGEHDADDVVAHLLGERDVGQHEVDAGQFRTGERHAHVDDQPLALARRAEAVHRDVHADLADATERHEDEVTHRIAFSGSNAGLFAVPFAGKKTSPTAIVSVCPFACRRTSRPSGASD